MPHPDPLLEIQRIPAMPCGLYRTGRALTGAEDDVPADTLVHLHDHRPEEWPTVHLPVDQQGIHWQFDDTGCQALDPAFLLDLLPLAPEGWYVLRQPLATGGEADATLPARSLVLLGYNRQAHCILFPAQFGLREVRFAERGFRFEDLAVLEALEPVNFDVPDADTGRIVH
ncbi:MAG: hypothetical protein HY902_04120 [Deltaproteobacteria bacterium]|nr:hypothetical protein [Deltaproteobacteria bacterium]